jgi:hypothetical protein
MGTLPSQVFIDGIPLYNSSMVKHHPSKLPSDIKHTAPSSAKWKSYEMITPPPWTRHPKETVAFTGIKQIFHWEDGSIQRLVGKDGALLSLLVNDGKIDCIGECESRITEVSHHLKPDQIVDLHGGTIIPPTSVFGSSLGLADISLSEDSTQDGLIADNLISPQSVYSKFSQLGEGSVRAMDGLGLGGDSLRLTYESGIVKLVVKPISQGFFGGTSVAFRSGAENSKRFEGCSVFSGLTLRKSCWSWSDNQRRRRRPFFDFSWKTGQRFNSDWRTQTATEAKSI